MYGIKAPIDSVWVKVAQVYFSEIRSGLKVGSPPGFLYQTNKWIMSIFMFLKTPHFKLVGDPILSPDLISEIPTYHYYTVTFSGWPCENS